MKHISGEMAAGAIGVTCKRALIVDDSHFSRALLRKVLGLLGVDDVVEAQDGEEAISCLASSAGRPIDVIFCDLDMPTVDGIQFIRFLASFADRPPFVIISGAAERTVRAVETLARDAGLTVMGSMAKPVKHDDISRILGELKPAPKRPPPRAAFSIGAADLADGLRDGQIGLHYQPKVDLTTRQLVGVEALARWQHPVHGLIYPDDFIPMAEEEGLVGLLTAAVLEKAIAQCAAWRRAGVGCKVSVNLSPKMITDQAMPDRLLQMVERAGVRPADLMFEITETGMFGDELLSMEILARLDLKGFGLSIDDFGTGFSSPQQLQRLPFAELKIDRMFVTGGSCNAFSQTIVSSSVHLARDLQMCVVVEGVETADDWTFVQEAGCDVAQGYFVARPMPAENILPWLETWLSRKDIPAAGRADGERQ